MGGDDLPVQVGQADFVVVDQVERPDAAARQRFDRIAADAADAEHRDPRMVQALHRLGAKLGLRACKLVNHRPCLPLFFPCAL